MAGLDPDALATVRANAEREEERMRDPAANDRVPFKGGTVTYHDIPITFTKDPLTYADISRIIYNKSGGSLRKTPTYLKEKLEASFSQLNSLIATNSISGVPLPKEMRMRGFNIKNGKESATYANASRAILTYTGIVMPPSEVKTDYDRFISTMSRTGVGAAAGAATVTGRAVLPFNIEKPAEVVAPPAASPSWWNSINPFSTRAKKPETKKTETMPDKFNHNLGGGARRRRTRHRKHRNRRTRRRV